MVWQPEPRASEARRVRKRWPKNNGSARAEREGRKTIFTQLVIIVEEQRRRREAATPGAGGAESEVIRVGRSTAEVPLESHEMFEHELSDQNLI